MLVHREPAAVGLPCEHDRLALIGVDLLTAEQRACPDAVRKDRGVTGELHTPVRRHALEDLKAFVGDKPIPLGFPRATPDEHAGCRVENERRCGSKTRKVRVAIMAPEGGDTGVCGSEYICLVAHVWPPG